jgi:hypothetical protein
MDMLAILLDRAITWLVRILARGPTGGALARDYHALQSVGVAVRQSIVSRYGCRRNVSEVCGYRSFVFV